MPTPEETLGDCVALAPRSAACASLDKWLPPVAGQKAPPRPPDRRIVAAALRAVLCVADAARQAVDGGLEIRVDDRQTEGGGRAVTILILPEPP